MARTRVASGIKSWEGADEALLAIGRLDRQIEQYEAELSGLIEEAKKETVAAVKPLQERKKALELQLQAFCTEHKAEMEGKSRKLNFGRVGFRLSTRVVIKHVKTCVAALLRLGLENWLEVKYTPNKERLKELDEATLGEIGVKVESGDVFGYEVDRQKIMEAA
jgi:phage host-nuclease inhibitor protein Gam